MGTFFRHPTPCGDSADHPPELLQAQFGALSRLVPLMYFILLANASVLAYTFRLKAPVSLTLYPALCFGAIFVWRTVSWWQRRERSITPDQARRQLAVSSVLASVLGALLAGWGFALFPHGDAYDQGHVAFFLSLTMISSMFCLVHAWPAPLLIGAFAGLPIVVFLSLAGVPVFAAMASDMALVTLATLLVLRIQGRDFNRMIAARAEVGRRGQEQQRLLGMIEDLPIAVMTADPVSLRINYANRAALSLVRRIEHLLPIRADQLVGTSIDVFHHQPEQQRRLLTDPARLPHTARSHVGGEILELQAAAVTDCGGEHQGLMVTLALVTAQVEAERRILHLAHHDSLTGLHNRYTFHEQVEQRLAGEGGGDGEMAVLVIDLDGFKMVNDTLGHRAGDSLLGEVAARLQTHCAGRATAVARLGGDEFAVLLPGGDPATAELLAHGLLGTLCAPYLLEGERHTRIGASVGIALSPQHGRDSETLLARADIALYAAKAAGRATVRTFTSEMLTRIQERVDLEARLRAAMEGQRGLFVFFQPITDLASGRITAREALVRWFDPPRGWIPSSEFVPVAEEAGLIDRLGQFVLGRACLEAAGWTDGARVAVNVSAAQLGRGTLLPAVSRALKAAALPADRLEVEITETALLLNGAQALAELRLLREMGVRVALDDFGTGYSSLAHLRSFPFDKIKIDGSFVRDALQRPECAAVVRAVAELGRRLGVTTVAEGVETPAHLECARAEGCTEVQGYLLGRPLPSPKDQAAVDALSSPVGTPPDRPVRPAATEEV